MKSHIRTWGIAALLGAALSLFCILPCLAAGSVGQVTLHIGQTPDTAYLTYSAPDAVHGAVTVTGPAGTAVYTAAPIWSDPAGKYLYTAELTGLFPGCTYTYEISGACAGTFQTAADDGAFTFAFLTDPQIGSMTDARATGAMFSLLNSRDDLAFAYIAGDLTDSARSERQWELLFRSGGVHDGAGQAFLSSHLLAAAQGNHDNSSFSGHITAPSAGGDAGPAVYSFDYSNMKFVVLNLNSPDTWTAQADFLRREAAEAKANDQWLAAGFHQSLYSGAAHIVDSGIISARRFWSPLLAEAGVDVVLQGHDHVYSRGFVTGAGVNAGLPVVRNGYHAGSGAPLYMTGGESGAVKWYAARDCRVSAGDLLSPCYSFLDVNSAVPAQNPWGTDSSRTHEQTFTLIRVDGDTMTFSTYMFRYDGRSDRMVTAPLSLRQPDPAAGRCRPCGRRCDGGSGTGRLSCRRVCGRAVRCLVRGGSRHHNGPRPAGRPPRGPVRSGQLPDPGRAGHGASPPGRDARGRGRRGLFRCLPLLGLLCCGLLGGRDRAGVWHGGRTVRTGCRDHPRPAGSGAAPLRRAFRGGPAGRKRNRDLCRLEAGGDMVPGCRQLGCGDRAAAREEREPSGAQRRGVPGGGSGLSPAAAVRADT